MIDAKALLKTIVVVVVLLAPTLGIAQEDERQKAMQFFATAGVPGDKWIEGETMLPHVIPAGHFYSTMLYYPGTEELQSNEVRVTPSWARTPTQVSRSQG